MGEVRQFSCSNKRAEETAGKANKKCKGGIHGVSWKHKEVLDLLALWADAKVQDVLKSSYWNMDCFEDIANTIPCRGYPRTAIECRNTTKALRLQYKKVFCHNMRLCKRLMPCQYYTDPQGGCQRCTVQSRTRQKHQN